LYDQIKLMKYNNLILLHTEYEEIHSLFFYIFFKLPECALDSGPSNPTTQNCAFGNFLPKSPYIFNGSKYHKWN
jgi:hypothetical protein